MPEAKNDCIFCGSAIPPKTKPEHVLLNALGGRLTVRKVICPTCNNQFGNGPDKDLAGTAAFLRNICSLKAGDGDEAPMIRGLESNGEKFDLKSGMRPVKKAKPMDVTFNGEEISISIEAYSEEEADRLLTAAARKIAKRLGHSEPEVVEAIKKDLQKDRRSSFVPAPPIRQSLEFGADRAQQSMAKACMVLWGKRCGNTELNSRRYDAIRTFAQARDEMRDQALVKLDTRPMTDVPEKFGTNPNVVCVASNAIGRTYGYFRLYGAIGWRFLLCENGAPANMVTCLISNPFDGKVWELFGDDTSPIKARWIEDHWETQQPHYDQVQNRLSSMANHAHEKSQRVWLEELTWKAFENAGCREGDRITEEHAQAVAGYVARALIARIFKVEVPDK